MANLITIFETPNNELHCLYWVHENVNGKVIEVDNSTFDFIKNGVIEEVNEILDYLYNWFWID